MKRMTKPIRSSILSTFIAILLIAIPQVASAHCDTLNGPVIKTARNALQKGDVTPILKWVRAKDEQAIRTAFSHTLQIRTLSPEAQQLADQYFFETLVRVHRAGEGVPYSGLKPSESISPAVLMADRALESGSADHLIEVLTQAINKETTERFKYAMKSQINAEQSIDEGRNYVANYIRYTHFVETIYSLVQDTDEHHKNVEPSVTKAHNH